MNRLFIAPLIAGLAGLAGTVLAQTADSAQMLAAPENGLEKVSSRAGCAALKYDKHNPSYDKRQSQNMATPTEDGIGACSEFEHSLYLQTLAPTQMLSAYPTAAGSPLTRDSVRAELQRAREAGELDFAQAELGLQVLPRESLRR